MVQKLPNKGPLMPIEGPCSLEGVSDSHGTTGLLRRSRPQRRVAEQRNDSGPTTMLAGTKRAYTDLFDISPELMRICHINLAILIATHGASGSGAGLYN